MELRQLINEIVSNELLLRSSIRSMLNDIQSRLPTKVTRGQVELETSHNSHWKLEVKHVAEDSYEIFERELKKYISLFDRNGTLMNYSKHKQGNVKMGSDLDITPVDGFTVTFIMSFKDKTTQRIVPSRFIYHFSKPENRSSIEKVGLEPRGWGDGSNWTHVPHLKYEPAVFAVNTENGVWGYKGWDKWRIDTQGLPNKWWQDLNFKDRKDLVMTFDPIPASHLRRIG